MFLPSLNTAVF